MSDYLYKGIVPPITEEQAQAEFARLWRPDGEKGKYTFPVEVAVEMLRLRGFIVADPDLLEAREIVAREVIGYSKSIREGTAYQERVDAILIGIKRGRELASGAE